MRISELSPDLRPTSPEHLSRLLEELESSIKDAEHLSPSDLSLPPVSLSSKLRKSLSRLNSVLPLPDSGKLQIWKLSYRLWNACVDLSNAASAAGKLSEEHAGLRQISADLLSLAGNPSGIPSPAFKTAAFYYRTGQIWHELRKFDLAASCFEKATDLTSKGDINTIPGAEERKLLLDLNVARSRTAWESGERNLALGLLNRSKSLLFRSPDNYHTLAGQYLMLAKSVLANGEKPSAINEAPKLINDALELCEKGLELAKTLEQKSGFQVLREKLLCFLAATHLQGEEFESVLKCVKVLREPGGSVSGSGEHSSVGFMAMSAWLGLGRVAEAEKELRTMVVNKSVPEVICVSALDAFFQGAGSAGVQAAKEAFLGLLGRGHVTAGAAVRMVHKMVTAGGGKGARAVAELVSDERVAELFPGDGEAVAKERGAMHAVMWNCGAEHFRAKDFEIAAEMFEKAMLYLPQREQNQVLRAKSFRVLCLCHLGLTQHDRAEEYINEAEKLDPNVTSAFLKFKIQLLKKDEAGAINQIQAMVNCVDFKPDFLTLSAREAMALRFHTVAIASLSSLLNLYTSGKSMPASEVTILRHIIALLLQNRETEDEILKFTRHARDRFSDIGSEPFFGKGAVGSRELNWFAGHSWNMGLKTAKAMNYELSSQFFQLAAEFYEANRESAGDENRGTACKSLILSVAAILANEQQKNETLTDTAVQKALQIVDRAGKLLSAIPFGTDLPEDQTTIHSNILFLHTFTAYELQGRMSGGGPQQLLLLKIFASSKACSPQHLLRIGLAASKGPRSNPEAAEFAFRACLTTLLLAAPSPDYKTIAMVVRKLVMVAGLREGEADDETYAVYKEAYRIMVGLKEGEYPEEEGKWLAITAWNRSSVPARLGQIDRARKWMRMGLELARQVTGMEAYKCSMEKCLTGSEKLGGEEAGTRQG